MGIRDSPKDPPTPVDLSELLGRTFILMEERLEEQRRTVEAALQRFDRIVENVRPINYINFEKGSVTIMVDKSSTDVSTHIAGNVGALAQTGAIQFIGSIEQNITQLQNNPETKAAAEAIKKLAEAIRTSPDVPSEYERETYLRDLNMLSEQAALPKEKRQPVTPIIDRIAGFCSGAGGLAAIWAVAGPPLMALFS